MIIKVPLYFEVNVKKKPSEVSMLINGLDESLYALLLETFGDTNWHLDDPHSLEKISASLVKPSALRKNILKSSSKSEDKAGKQL